MMPMYFFVSDQVILLFDFWNVHSVAGMVLTVVIVLLMTLSYEILKVETVKLDKKILDLMTATPNTQDETAETLPINPNAQNTSLKRVKLNVLPSQFRLSTNIYQKRKEGSILWFLKLTSTPILPICFAVVINLYLTSLNTAPLPERDIGKKYLYCDLHYWTVCMQFFVP
ncbi:probable low affinity copper uptake protein 2 isoform X1 [Carcharodon carcharias]|uniref:probable low affinity copper uptake protein 2 isoform X1 n=2 Tax=Carcharodon carcharias TaxID=13397 RepID=UPI001B7F194F|nr:probable low affinity copper uptake protein 2 isoform X1 [Carcharodon carcharias]